MSLKTGISFALFACLCLSYTSADQNDASQQSQDSRFITQTVYGFLDFTTTIGNTVMVFSPNSAPAPMAETPASKEKESNEEIIDTKPSKFVVQSVPDIKPSKISNHDEEMSDITDSSLSDRQVPNTPKSSFDPKTIITKVEVLTESSKITENKLSDKPSKPITNNKKTVKENSKINKTSPVKTNAKDHKLSDDKKPSHKNNTKIIKQEQEPIILLTSENLPEPEYDFLSRQPSEFVEETYKVINIRPTKSHPQKSKQNHKHRQLFEEDDDHPLGLVTTFGDTMVKDGITTVHETSVIGTYISGKYAQVLNSNSKIIQSPHNKIKVTPSSSHRILKTIGPAISKHPRHNLEPTPAINDDDTGYTKNFQKQNHKVTSFKNRHNRQNNDFDSHENSPNHNQSKKYKSRHVAPPPQRSHSDASSSSYSGRRKSSRVSGQKSFATHSNSYESQPRRGFKPRVQPTPVEHITQTSSSIYKFKLNRAPGSGRWQYKTSPKPKVTIRKAISEIEQQTTPNVNQYLEDADTNNVSPQSRSDNDLELSGSQNGGSSLIDNDTDDNSLDKPPPVETLKVQISTPVDFSDVYYEIATIKSPYVFQVGRVKNTRIITVTSTIQKSIVPTASLVSSQLFDEPLSENILATASPYDKDNYLLDSSIATLPAITLSSDIETPPLETITETFSTTQSMLKTHILPVVHSNLTNSLTFIQTYHVTRYVTATKTLPPMDYFQFIPSKTLKEFNSRLDEAGSELHLELDFGESNEDEEGLSKRVFPADLDLASIGSNFDLAEMDKQILSDNHLRLKKAHGQNKLNHVTETPTPPTPALSPEQAQQLALLRLLNPAAAAQIPNVVTTSKPILKYETVYESHVIPVFDGKNTIQSTISRPVATVTKTEYEIGTSSLPAIPLPPVNPLFPQQFSVISTPVVVNTDIVATDSQILKLTFGAKTVYTTLYSTKVVPTVITSYLTSSIPVQPTAGFPGYFPAPYAPFPYVG